MSYKSLSLHCSSFCVNILVTLFIGSTLFLGCRSRSLGDAAVKDADPNVANAPSAVDSRWPTLASVLPAVADFPATSNEVRLKQIETIQVLLAQVWANRAQKDSGHGIPTVKLEDLEALKAVLPTLDEKSFQLRIMKIFLGLKDLHTLYKPALPIGCMMAKLPLAFAAAVAPDGHGGIFVSKITSPEQLMEPPAWLGAIEIGDELITYDGIAASRVATKLGFDSPAAFNTSAQETRGVDGLWSRGSFWVPENTTVSVTLVGKKGPRNLLLPWYAPKGNQCLAHGAAALPAALPVGKTDALKTPPVNTAAENAEGKVGAGSVVFGRPSGMRFDEGPILREANLISETSVPSRTDTRREVATALEVEFKDGPNSVIKTAELLVDGKKTLVIRFTGFDFDPLTRDEWMLQIKALLKEHSDVEAVVWDTRRNGGGDAEMMLSLVKIHLQRKVGDLYGRVRANSAMDQLTRKLPALDPEWTEFVRGLGPAIAAALEKGNPLTEWVPFQGEEILARVNTHERIVSAPTAVIIDGGCYSSCDFFSARMQDENRAQIWGYGQWQSGGGGAAVLGLDDLVKAAENTDLGIVPFAGDASMTVGVFPIKRLKGGLIEDNGVRADRVVDPLLADIAVKNPLSLYQRVVRGLLSSKAGVER